jgi:hypothetical protein
MPALRGSLTYARYYVDGDVPSDYAARYGKAIRLRAMKPLDPDEEALERSGWCRIGDPMEVELGHGDVFLNDFINLGFRTDRWAIPGPMLRAKLREAETAYLGKVGRERLTRKERAELKEVAAKKIRRQITPATRAADLSWAIGLGLVRFFSASPKQGVLMEGLFAKTFGLRLVPEGPYTLAARLGMSKADEKAWEDLEPTIVGKADVGLGG